MSLFWGGFLQDCAPELKLRPLAFDLCPELYVNNQCIRENKYIVEVPVTEEPLIAVGTFTIIATSGFDSRPSRTRLNGGLIPRVALSPPYVFIPLY